MRLASPGALLGGATIKERMEAAGGFTSGFDLMRIALAVSVVAFHSALTTYGADADHALWAGPYRGFFSSILPTFFALSGFLVAGSLARVPSLPKFLTLRAIRIGPALAVEVLLCAFLLGPALTSVDLGTYFTDPKFFVYFRNMVGDVHFELPGVFLNNPFPGFVNASLWTVPFELECYVALAVLSLLGVVRRRWALLAFTVLACVALPVIKILIHAQDDFFWRPSGRLLVLCFLAGLTIFQFREKVVCNFWLAAAAYVLSVYFLSDRTTCYMAAPCIAYTTVCLGMTKAPKLPLVMTGDYSYGLYLFSFPIQQAYVQLFPDYRIWYLNIAFTLVCGFAYAAFSWHCVEKPILRRKNDILAWVDKVVARVSGAVKPRVSAAPQNEG